MNYTNTKRTVGKTILPLLALIAITALGLAGCTDSSQKDAAGGKSGQTVQYTCSMHPDVVKDAPGDCPKCGMKLVEKH